MNEEEKASLPLIEPFGRVPAERRRHKRRKDGETHREGFEASIHDAIRNHTPTTSQGFVLVTREDAQVLITGTKTDRTDVLNEACFLWVIDEVSIKMMRERNRNTLRDPAFVCHTNLTGNTKARIGGELFFCEDGTIIISQKSDRYGWAPEEQFEVALNYFRRVGYKNLIVVAP